MEEKSNKNPAIKNALGKRKIPISKQIEPNLVTLLLFFVIGNPNYYSNKMHIAIRFLQDSNLRPTA